MKVVSFDEFIEFIEGKIAPFTLNEKRRSEIALLYNRYPLEFLYECINIGISRYFGYDENGNLTNKSVEDFLNKIGGIAYNKSQSPIIQEISHIKGIAKKAFTYWDGNRADEILFDYITALKNAGWSEYKITVDLKTEVVGLISKSYSWPQWCNSMRRWINDIHQWEKDDDTEIKHEGTILSDTIFQGTPSYIQNLCKQINASYENNLFDCSAVIMCRLLEILLVLSYQNMNMESEIMSKNENRHIAFDKIIKNAEQNQKLSLSQNTKKDISIFKDLGNYSAHKIWYNCTQKDIQPNILKYRAIIEELLYKAGIK